MVKDNNERRITELEKQIEFQNRQIVMLYDMILMNNKNIDLLQTILKTKTSQDETISPTEHSTTIISPVISKQNMVKRAVGI